MMMMIMILLIITIIIIIIIIIINILYRFLYFSVQTAFYIIFQVTFMTFAPRTTTASSLCSGSFGAIRIIRGRTTGCTERVAGL